MNKKSIKLFAVSALTFFASSALVNAKTYTSLDALTKDVEAWREEKNAETSDTKEDNNIWVVGEYVFTSNYKFETWENLATAFQSIPTSSKPYIFVIERTYDGLDATGWDIANKTNLFKNAAALPEKVNIQYIDMEKFGEKVYTTDEVDSLVNVANGNAGAEENASIYKAYNLSLDKTTGKITFTAEKPKLVLETIKNSGIAAKIKEILDTGAYSEIKITDKAEGGKTISLLPTDDTETIKNKVIGLITPATTLADLTNKKLTVEFVLKEGKIPADNNLTEFELDFVSIAKTNEYFENQNGGSYYKLNCESASDSEKCKAVINILTPTQQITENQYGLDALSVVINNAFNSKLVNSVNLQLGNKYRNLEYTEVNNLNDLAAELRKYLVQVATTYNSLTEKDFGDIVIKFNLVDGAISNYNSEARSEEYKFEVGSYLDIDQIMKDFATSASTNTGAIVVEDNTIKINAKLDNNTLDNNWTKIGKIADALNSLMDKFTDGSVTINGAPYVKDVDRDNSSNLRAIIKSLIGVDSWTPMTVDKFLGMPEFDLVIKTTKSIIPNATAEYTKETVEDVTTSTITYKVLFSANEFDFDYMMSNFKDATGHFTYTYDNTITEQHPTRSLDIKLSNINTKLGSITGSSLLSTLAKYNNLVTVTANDTVLDLSNTETLKAQILEVLKVTAEDTIEKLNNKEITLNVKLSDKVTPKVVEGNEAETEYTVNVVFKSDAIVKLTGATGEPSLSDLVKSDSKAEVVYLSSNYTVPEEGTLEIAKNGLSIKGDGKAAITGDVKVTGNNVTLDNVVINGVNNLGEEANETNHVFVVEATGANFTLTNSKVSYDKDAHYAYGLVTADGKVTITGNTFDITNVKNPIEFKSSSTVADGTEISNNHFVGNNYSIKGAEVGLSVARNVISIYGVNADGARITINNNTFEYANWAIRISNNGNHKAIYNITNNKVLTNKAYTTGEDDSQVLVVDGQTALVGIQELSGQDISNIIINYKDNYVNTNADYTGGTLFAVKDTNNRNYAGFDRLGYTSSSHTPTFNEIRN